MIVIWATDFRDAYKESGTFKNFVGSPKWRQTLYFFAVIIISILFVHTTDFGSSLLAYEDWILYPMSAILAAMISGAWIYYLWQVDTYEKEPILAIIITIALSCCAIWLVFPITDVLNDLGFRLNGDAWNNWWYSFIAIGLVEEIVKIIPVLAIIYFSREVNEPFDYIFYGSISALGFAFIENTMYIADSNLTAVLARAMYASVAHMFFTSVICYCLAIIKYRLKKYRWAALPGGLLLAALGHGFYDFWLIQTDLKLWWITSIFFVVSVHIWVMMKNNLVNLSPMFIRGKSFGGRELSYRIINWLITILYTAYIFTYLLYGPGQASFMIFTLWITNIYVIIFVALNFGRYEPIQGYLASPNINMNYFKLLMPNLFYEKSDTGTRVRLDPLPTRGGRQHPLSQFMPLQGTFSRRIVFEKDTNCYLMEPEQNILNDQYESRYLLVKNDSRDHSPGDSKAHPVMIYAMKNLHDVPFGRIHEENVELLGTFICRGIS